MNVFGVSCCMQATGKTTPTSPILCVLRAKVIIHGFRSYRDQTVIDPFSPKNNVVGKSSDTPGLLHVVCPCPLFQSEEMAREKATSSTVSCAVWISDYIRSTDYFQRSPAISGDHLKSKEHMLHVFRPLSKRV